jgi:tellurite resistance protein
MVMDVTNIKKPLFTEAEVLTCIKMATDDGTITAEEKKCSHGCFP